MKRNFVVGLLGSVIVSMGLLVIAGVVAAQGPTPPKPKAPTANAGTAFSYEGQLKNNGAPVNGMCDFQFGLWDAASAGTQVGITQTLTAINVTNGLFTVSIDFGANAFTGDARWLSNAVRCPAGSGSYAALNPLQALTPAPIALALPGLYTQQNGDSPNLIGGYSGNIVAPGSYGATIGGGGDSNYPNVINGVFFDTIGGGWGNTAGNDYATIGGGMFNIVGVSGDYSTVGGGVFNSTSGHGSTVGGGVTNSASGYAATVGGGYNNTATGYVSTVPGGSFNSATMTYTFAAGQQAQANHQGAFVWADSTNGVFASTGNDQFLVRASGGVGINTNAPARSLDVNGVVGVFDGGTRNLYGGLASEVGARLIDLGINDDVYNRFGGTYTTTAQGGLMRVDTRPGYDLFQFYGRTAGSTLLQQVMSLNSAGVLKVNNLAGAGSAYLCYNASNQISACSSSVRYKDNIASLNLGLETVAQLRPVTFNWKTNGESDLGFVAEEVNQVTPLLTTLNKDGQIEGVKYDRLSAVLVKAMQEQQQQIADLKAQNATLKQTNESFESRLAALEQTVQTNNAGANSDNAGNIAMIVISAVLGIVVVQKLWQRGTR